MHLWKDGGLRFADPPLRAGSAIRYRKTPSALHIELPAEVVADLHQHGDAFGET